MSNLDYTLGIVSNIISESTTGIGEEFTFVNTYGSDQMTNSQVANSGPNISVYQSLNYMFVVWRTQASTDYDYYLLGFYFMKLIAGFLNFKAPNVSSDIAED